MNRELTCCGQNLLGQLLNVSSSRSSYSDLFRLLLAPIRGVFSPLRDFFCLGVLPDPEPEL